MPRTSRKYRLTSSTSSCSFHVNEVMFQFPVTSLWRDWCLCVSFKSPSSLRLPRCVAGANPFVDSWRGNCRYFFEHGPWITCATTDARWLQNGLERTTQRKGTYTLFTIACFKGLASSAMQGNQSRYGTSNALVKQLFLWTSTPVSN